MTYYDGCGNHPVNSQWTNKYLPEKAIERIGAGAKQNAQPAEIGRDDCRVKRLQRSGGWAKECITGKPRHTGCKGGRNRRNTHVCGNEESVSFLSEWLHLWHQRDFRSSNDLPVDENFIVQDDYYNCSQSDCDSDNRDEENSLKNVLLVTGPVGSGKSAAIYACAKEQGFHVIEVNASDWRTRTLVMQRFEGGVVESHCVQRTLRSPVGSENKYIQKSFPITSNTTAVQGSNCEVIELIPLSDGKDSQNATGTPEKFICKNNTTAATDQSASKPLILFEDVDAVLSEDHGLIATIQKLAETSKRPIILTSNSHKPFLPNSFDRLELCFTKPSLKELRCHAYMVCAAEKVKIQPCFVERFIGCCQGDIRKTIMHLQFWCQGQRCRKVLKDAVVPGRGRQRLLHKASRFFTSSMLGQYRELCFSRIEVLEGQNNSFFSSQLKLFSNEMIRPSQVEAGNLKSLQSNCSMFDATYKGQIEVGWTLSRSNRDSSESGEKQRGLQQRSARSVGASTRVVGVQRGSVEALCRIDEVLISCFKLPDNKEQLKFGPLLFDLDAGHRILPKIIPWSYPSQLSEIVEEEITKSMLMMEEFSKLMKIVEEGHLNKNEMHNLSKQCKSETDVVKAKKEAILRRHCPLQDGNEFPTQANTACEYSNSSGSPIAFTRRNCRRKLDTVLSSNSGNDNVNDRFPVVGDIDFEDTNSGMFFEVDSKSPSYCLEPRMCFGPVPEQLLYPGVQKLEESFNPLSEFLLNSEGEKLVENSSFCSENALYSHINGTQKSVDLSCVPESSFVPETQINDGTLMFCRTVSSYHVDDMVEAVSTSNDLLQNVQPVETHNPGQYVSGLQKKPEITEHFDTNTESAHGEEVGDSHAEHVEAVPRGYQVMDECSRMDCSRGAKSENKPGSSVLVDSIQETWRRIRGFHTDLRQYVTPEQKDASQVLKLAYGMSHLISEADLLLGHCHPLIRDSLEPSMVPFEKSHSFSWFDDQVCMTSTIAQHGICFYAKEIAVVGSNVGSVNRMDLVSEMLTSSTNTMALGKLISQDTRIESSEMGPLKSVSSVKRVRVARNYLSTGGLMLSPDNISLLGQYKRVSSLSMDTSLR
ncbi:P-loop containing nucleoside triphosphate hydrolases superfamily protein [Actinidia rufa]|uniref:P-loop containing nucleoside triphosphate hydrolases superfamily protein n=1 Tax=Actinidia rufa TaxID=165716 RepID=A0A7J0EFV9_9ERIC|nr:P-loop containing nucleoside triphosphate hydrolases superfamily protein [Actinidia rufa]